MPPLSSAPVAACVRGHGLDGWSVRAPEGMLSVTPGGSPVEPDAAFGEVATVGGFPHATSETYPRCNGRVVYGPAAPASHQPASLRATTRAQLSEDASLVSTVTS